MNIDERKNKLRIEETESGYGIFLDDKELRWVERYNVKKDSLMPGCATLTLKMLVEYP